jgi:signal peptidase II
MLQIIIIVLALVADQLVKILLVPLFAMPGSSIEVIPGVFNLTYVENTGASFGIFHNAPWAQTFFIVITFAVLIAATWLMIKYRKKHRRFLKVAIALAYAGAVGNLIDRIQYGYVRDFFDFRMFGDLWKWIFNVADVCLVIGSIMLGIYILFMHKDKPKDNEAEPEPKEKEELAEGDETAEDGEARPEEPTKEGDKPEERE